MDVIEAEEYFHLGLAHEVDNELTTISVKQIEYEKEVESLLSNPLTGSFDIQKLQSDMADVKTRVKDHKKSVLLKKREVFPPSSLSSFENYLLTKAEINAICQASSSDGDQQDSDMDKTPTASPSDLSLVGDGEPGLPVTPPDLSLGVAELSLGAV